MIHGDVYLYPTDTSEARMHVAGSMAGFTDQATPIFTKLMQEFNARAEARDQARIDAAMAGRIIYRTSDYSYASRAAMIFRYFDGRVY